jgi:predicted NAD/FAD-binding protein
MERLLVMARGKECSLWELGLLVRSIEFRMDTCKHANKEVIGMSCAHHLAEHQDKFDVTVIDAVDYCGGQAFAIPLDKEKYGASWLNQGVQGGSYIFHHTMTMFARQGHYADPVKLQVRSRYVFELVTRLMSYLGVVR